MRHCHFHFFRKIRFSLCLSLFLIGLGIFCAAVCKCADSDTWIVQFLTNPQADSGKSSSDVSSENTTTLNAAFTDYVTELFRQEASANLLNLHYTLADPAAYGITDYQTSLGTCSADSPALAAAFAENLLAGLQQFQSAELSAENRLTLDILSESLDLTKNGANWYCYEEPLTPTTGLQSQIPILLAEYTFRNTRDITDYLSLLSDIPRYFSEISTYEKEKAAAGRFMPSFAAQRLIQQCKDFTADLNSHYLVATFNEKTDAMSELSKIATFWNSRYFRHLNSFPTQLPDYRIADITMPASVIFRKGTPIMNIWCAAIPEAMTPSPHWKNVPPASAKRICFWYQNCWKITRISLMSQNDSISPHSLPKKCWLRCSRRSLPTFLPSRIAM